MLVKPTRGLSTAAHADPTPKCSSGPREVILILSLLPGAPRRQKGGFGRTHEGVSLVLARPASTSMPALRTGHSRTRRAVDRTLVNAVTPEKFPPSFVLGPQQRAGARTPLAGGGEGEGGGLRAH